MPYVSQKMLRPSYWEKALGNEAGRLDAFEMPKNKPEELIRLYLDEIKVKSNGSFFNHKGEQILPGKWDSVISNIPLHPDIEYGLIVRRTDLKLFPQIEPLLSEPSQLDIDRNQLSGLEPGDKALVFSATFDQKWLAVITRQGTGWVRKEALGIGPQGVIRSFDEATPRITITQPDSKILTKSGTILISMGNSLPVVAKPDQIIVPQRKPDGGLDFVLGRIEGVYFLGCMECNQSNLIEFIFKYLGYNYAWGDYDCFGYGVDCSRLIQNVLSALGFQPPRNSQDQLRAAKEKIFFLNLSAVERAEQLHRIKPGSLLYTPSHVMIYLGEVDKRFYIIHALHSYQALTGERDTVRRIKKVVVSDLSLGEGTILGSLLERLSAAVVIF